MTRLVTVVGGGLAGSECALSLAARGIPVRLYEQRPGGNAPAHRTQDLAELVCEGKLTRKEFCNQYKGWRGDKTRYDAHGIIVQMDNLYHDLLGGIENGRE